MAKIGSFEYPDFHLKTLLDSIEILVNKFGGKISSSKTFAEAMGHKSDKSGAYLRKVADLRRYGFLEKRDLTATNIAKNIVKPLRGEKEKKECLNKAIKNISLWIRLYERLKNKTPNLDEFKLQLAEITRDDDETRKSADKIRKVYIEAMSYYDKNLEAENNGDYGNQESYSNEDLKKTFDKNKMIDGKIGQVYVQLPRNLGSIEIAKQIVNMLEIQIKNEAQDFNPAGTQPVVDDKLKTKKQMRTTEAGTKPLLD